MSGSPHPPPSPFSYSQLHTKIAERKCFNLAKSLATASWHWSFSFSPALAKMRIRYTHSQMHKATKNRAEWNCDIWAYNMLWNSARGSMPMESALDDLNSTAAVLPPISLAAEPAEVGHKKEPSCKVLSHNIYLRNCHQPALATGDTDRKFTWRKVTRCRSLHFGSKNRSAGNTSLWCS